MMTSYKIPGWLAAAAICSLLLAGCTPPAEVPAISEVEPVKPVQPVQPVEPKVLPEVQVPKPPAGETVTLAMKFTPQDSTTYKVITEGERSLKFEGSLSGDSTLKGGKTGSRIEMTYTQQIQSVDDKGNAVAKITIKQLTYLAKEKDVVHLDFDSSREEDQKNLLAKLIGQSYTIEITPAGQVTKVTDVGQARAAVRGSTSADRRASELLKLNTIKERHSISALPVAEKSQLRAGDNWSSIKTVSFGLMGVKSYERVYTLKDIKDADNRPIATVEMEAIPTSETAEQLYQQQQTSGFSKMFDSTETYTGQLKLDLTTGKAEKYVEKLLSEWVIVDPEAKKADREPDALKMAAIRLHSIEKID